MASLQTVLESCQAQTDELAAQAQARLALWEKWLQPIITTAPTGDDPGYDDDFQQIREEVNKLSGADLTLIGELAEKVLTTASKDIRVATYLCVVAAAPGGRGWFCRRAGTARRAACAFWHGAAPAARAQPSGGAGVACGLARARQPVALPGSDAR